MNFDFLGENLSPERSAELRRNLLKRLKMNFFPDRQESIPISCRIKPVWQSSQLEKSWFRNISKVVVYMENYDLMVLAEIDDVLRFLNSREPWQDFDVCIFDEDMTWCAALTHNDEAKFLNLE